MLELMLAAEGDPSAFGLTPTGWVALAMIAVFGLFIWKKVPAAVGRALDKKIDEIRAQLKEAEDLRDQAEALRKEYEAKAKSADKEAEAMVERAKGEAKQIVAKAKKDAKSLVERRQKMAEEKIAAEERAAIAGIRSATAKAATAAAAKLVEEAGDADVDKKLVDEAIAKLG